MSVLLIPTDFSEVANHALAVAKLIAKKTNAHLHLAHFYTLPIADYTYPDVNMPAELMTQMREDAKIALEQLSSTLQNEGFTVETTMEMGSITDEIVNLAKEIKATMIIMGTTGAAGIINKIMGSNAANVMQRTEQPILLIPQNCTCTSYNNIVYLDELKEDDTEVLKKVFEFAKTLDAKNIKLLNVNTGFFFKPIDEKLMQKLDDTFGLENIKLETSDGADIQEGIEHYLENHKADLLVMSTHKKSFLERIFSSSDTIKVAQYTTVPLLVYHKV